MLLQVERISRKRRVWIAREVRVRPRWGGLVTAPKGIVQVGRPSVSSRTRTAHHEAGHAVLSAAINDMPLHASIRAAHRTLGRTAQRMFARPTSLAQLYLAGFAAEHLRTS